MAEILSPFTAKAETWGQRLSIVMILPLRSTRSAEPTEPRQEKSVKITVNIVIKIRNSFLIKSGTLRLLIYKSTQDPTNKKTRYWAGLDGEDYTIIYNYYFFLVSTHLVKAVQMIPCGISRMALMRLLFAHSLQELKRITNQKVQHKVLLFQSSLILYKDQSYQVLP